MTRADQPRAPLPPLVGTRLGGEADLADRLGIAVYVAEPGPSGQWLYVSPAVTDLVGFTPEEFRADSGIWVRQLHPQDRNTVVARETSLSRSGRVRSEYRLIRRDGQVVWVLDDAVLAEGDNGEDVLHGFLVDVTSRKRTELMLAAQADIVEAVAAGASLQEVLTSLAGAVEGLSGGARCVVEVSAARFSGQPTAVSADGVATGAGHREPAVVQASPILSPTGDPLGRLVLRYPRAVPSRDGGLTAWGARLASLAISRAGEHDRMATSVALLEATLESTVDGILVVDRSGRIAGHNETFARMWRIDPKLLAAGDDANVMASVLGQLADGPAFVAQVRRLYDHPEQTSFDELSFRDGRTFERYSRPQRVDGTTVGRVWSFRDVSEKRRLKVDLRDSQDNLRLLVGQVRDYAILNLDPAGRITTWTAGAQRIKGYTDPEILGQHFSVFYRPEDVAAGRPAHALEVALADGQFLDEGWRVRKDGSLFWASVVITALHDDRGHLRGFGKVTRDITDQHQAQRALHEQARTLELLGEVATASNSASSVEEALTAALEAFARFGDWQLAHAYLADHDDPSALHHSVWHDERPGAFTGFRAATEAAQAGEVQLPQGVFSSPAPIWLPSLEGDPSFGRVAEAAQAGLVAACAFPILVRDQPVGVLEFFSTEPHPTRPDVLQVMQHLGTQLGRVVERDRAELRAARHAAQLERLTNQLTTVLNSAGDGIYGVDADGGVTFINEAGAGLLGLPRASIVGRAVEDVVQAETEPGAWEQGAATWSTAGPTASAVPRLVTGRHRRADGTEFDSESISAPIIQDGTVAGAVVVFRDVSERRAVDRMKDEFISVVSHELRTPLTAIRGALGLIGGGAAGPIPPPVARMVEVATTSADRLIRLVTDILDVERIAAGRMPLHPRPTEAGALIATAVDETAALAAERQTSITVGSVKGSVLADPDRIVQVLTTLMRNAIKFGPLGSAVQVSSTVQDTHVRFEIRDHGPGLAADQLEQIFEPFRQADASDTRRHGGSGLGLAICRGLVEQHQGRIWATSAPGDGATFSFTLPRVLSPESFIPRTADLDRIRLHPGKSPS